MRSSQIDILHIRKLVILGLSADDYLMEILVLKGGNAVDLLNRPQLGKNLSRTSYDLDFSIEDDFDEDLEDVIDRIEKTLTRTFAESDLILFDFKFFERPKIVQYQVKDFWGGYYIEFKVISLHEYQKIDGNLDKMRRQSLVIKPDQTRRVQIEISKYEYIGDKIEMNVEGHTIYIYSPQMLVFEKIRAICQQQPAYSAIVPSHSSRARARDFYDINLIVEQHAIDAHAAASRELLAQVFEAKKVPLHFIQDISAHSAIHRDDWQNVIDTLPASDRNDLQSFDYYLEYVRQFSLKLTSP